MSEHSATTRSRGLPDGPQVGETYAREQSHCASCPKLCRHVCPVAEAEQRETVTPWGLMSALFLQGRGVPILEGAEGELLYHCSGCRACQQFCHFQQDVSGALHDARATVFARGDAPAGLVERAEQVREALEDEGPANRLKALIPEAYHRPDARELLWLDSSATDLETQVQNWIYLLDALDLKEVGFYLGTPQDCGRVLYEAGDSEGYEAHARAVIEALGERRAVYHTSPDSAALLRRTFKTLAPGLKTRISHVVALLEAHEARLPRMPISATPVVLHEPCHLSRSLDHPDALFRLVTTVNGTPPRRPLRHGAESFCSGGGGGLPEGLPDTAATVARGCLERLSPGAGERILTACPGAQRQLDAVSIRPVVDVVTWVVEAMRHHGGALPSAE